MTVMGRIVGPVEPGTWHPAGANYTQDRIQSCEMREGSRDGIKYLDTLAHNHIIHTGS